MSITYTKKEVLALITGALAIAFTIAFDDKLPLFIPSYWITNYLTISLLTLVVLIIFTSVTKYAAHHYQTELTFEIWNIRRFGFGKGAHTSRHLFFGIFLPFILAFVSEGKIPFGGALQYTTNTHEAQRLGRTYTKLTEFESAKIAVAAPLTILFLALILKLFVVPFQQTLVTIISVVSVTTLLPLPGFHGLKAYLGSPSLYFFSFLVIISTVLLIDIVAPVLLVVLSLFFALFLTFLRYKRVEKL